MSGKAEKKLDVAALCKDLDKAAEKYARVHYRWTPETDDILRRFFGRVEQETLAAKLGCTRSVLRSRAHSLGLTRNAA